MLRFFIHYGLHFLFPAFLAKAFWPQKWKKVWGIFLLSMLVDLDHLLSEPIFDPYRLSVGNHLLHSYPAIFIYFICLFIPRFRIVAIALLFHMFTDFVDYLLI
ncbi:MAG: DUF6122 family protein [Bacteriovoracaceae bacterium]|nr:hypothetical protein [Halobacteriovoraceae bacterium]MDP7320590.1 DUF6122 family protein [Bacteriovoracaceae bacterium]